MSSVDNTSTSELRDLLSDVYAALTSGSDKRVELGIQEFRSVYQTLLDQEAFEDKQIFGIMFGTRALFWFPERPGLEFHVVASRPLTQSDFSFLLKAYLTGATDGTYSWWRFLFDELRNWRTWLAALLATAATLTLFYGSWNRSISVVLAATLPAIALFASVFVLFAVSQRTISSSEAILLKSPLYHRYGQIDKYVAWILSFGLLAGVAALIGNATSREPLSVYIGSAAFRLGTLGLAFFAASWGITSLIGFYFDRATTIQRLTAIPNLKEAIQREYGSAEHI